MSMGPGLELSVERNGTRSLSLRHKVGAFAAPARDDGRRKSGGVSVA